MAKSKSKPTTKKQEEKSSNTANPSNPESIKRLKSYVNFALLFLVTTFLEKYSGFLDPIWGWWAKAIWGWEGEMNSILVKTFSVVFITTFVLLVCAIYWTTNQIRQQIKSGRPKKGSGLGVIIVVLWVAVILIVFFVIFTIMAIDKQASIQETAITPTITDTAPTSIPTTPPSVYRGLDSDCFLLDDSDISWNMILDTTGVRQDDCLVIDPKFGISIQDMQIQIFPPTTLSDYVHWIKGRLYGISTRVSNNTTISFKIHINSEIENGHEMQLSGKSEIWVGIFQPTVSFDNSLHLVGTRTSHNDADNKIYWYLYGNGINAKDIDPITPPSDLDVVFTLQDHWVSVTINDSTAKTSGQFSSELDPPQKAGFLI